HFGSDEHPERILTLPEFYGLLEQQEQSGSGAITSKPSANPAVPKPPVLSVEKGHFVKNLPLTNDKANNTEIPERKPWIVKAQGFVFRVQSRFAISKGVLSDGDPADDIVVVESQTPIYAKPMHLLAGKGDDDQHISSTLTITITAHFGVDPFICSSVIKKVPYALWGPCKFISR